MQYFAQYIAIMPYCQLSSRSEIFSSIFTHPNLKPKLLKNTVMLQFWDSESCYIVFFRVWWWWLKMGDNCISWKYDFKKIHDEDIWENFWLSDFQTKIASFCKTRSKSYKRNKVSKMTKLVRNTQLAWLIHDLN